MCLCVRVRGRGRGSADLRAEEHRYPGTMGVACTSVRQSTHPSVRSSVRPCVHPSIDRGEPMTRAVPFTRSSICWFDGSNVRPSILTSVRPWNRSPVSDVVRQRGREVWWCGAVGERVMGMDESTDDNCDPIGGRGAVKRVRSTQLGVKGDGGALIRCLSVCACACGCVGVVVPTYRLRSIDSCQPISRAVPVIQSSVGWSILFVQVVCSFNCHCPVLWGREGGRCQSMGGSG